MEQIMKKKYPKMKIACLALAVLLAGVSLFAAVPAAEAAGSFSGLTRFMGMIQTTLVYGVFYALLALGFALIFGAARVVNLYHGTFYMLGAYLFATFCKPSPFNFPLSAFLFFQIVIIVGMIYTGYKKFSEKESKNKPVFTKLRFPVVMMIFAEVPLLLLFLRIDLPIAGNFNLFISLIFTCGLIGLLSMLLNKSAIQPVKKESVAVLIVTIALAFFTERLIDAIYGSSNVPVPSFIETSTVQLIFDATIDSKRLLMFFVGIFLIAGVWLLMNKTKTGKGVLAVAQDSEAATLMGINTQFVFNFAIMLSAILAAVAGIFTTPFLGDASPAIWLGVVIKAFAVVILGGLGSIFGSVLAAFILAFVEKFTKFYISSSLEEIVFLVIIIIILLIRPQGLFGKKGRF